MVGGILAKGVVTATQDVTDTVKVQIYPSAITANTGVIMIRAYAKDITGNLTAYGGAGGVASGTSVKAAATTTAKALVEFPSGSSANHATVAATGGDIFISTGTDTEARVYGRIKFTVNGLNTLATNVTNTMTIDSKINLGNYTEITAGNNLTIQALVERIYAYAEAYSETGAIINTQSKPSATVTIAANAAVTGNQVKLQARHGKLMILASANAGKIYSRAYSYGYTAGATGSVVSTATNDTRLYGNVTINGSASEMRARDISITASAPRESRTSYSKTASYKADTVTEYVETVVTKTKEVIEYVSENICKWLPWPLNKIVKWITKAVVKVITWTETLIIEKVLQSKTDKVEKGSYGYGNTVTLNGHLYYGTNAPVTITIDSNGNVKDANVKTSSDNKTITIESFNPKSQGSLRIESADGTVVGNVTVHNGNMLSALTIVNNSRKNLVVKQLDLLTENSAEDCAYQILCRDYSKFNMNDVVDDDFTQPIVKIETNQGTDVTMNGLFSYYTAILNIIFNGTAGNVYFGPDGTLNISQLKIENAEKCRYSRIPIQGWIICD